MSHFSLGFSVFGNRYYFTPKFTLLSLMIMLMLVGFGTWQLKQAHLIMDTIQMMNKRINLDPIQVDNVHSGRDLRYYPIQMEGSFDNEHQILLYNRLYKGQRGYELLTPFKPADSSTEYLIDRGWIAANPNPDKLPDIDPVPDGVTLIGTLFKPQDYFMLGSDFDEKKVNWPLLSKRANLNKISRVLSAPLAPYIVLLEPSSPYGFVREWTWLTSALTPERNQNFANQWFILALIMFAMFIFTNISRE